ncbi:MAG: hypothetical protein WCK84_01575 [Bacteroidota bacterium]
MKMKKLLPLIVLFFITGHVFSQKTLVVEKIGTSRRFFYHTGDYVKLRVSRLDTLLKGKIWFIKDSLISVEELRPFEVHLGDIRSVYKQFGFPKRFGAYLGAFGVGIFAIMATNHLLNNEQVFTTDMFIISGAFIGGSIISFSLSQKRCKIGNRWKVKILEININ